MDLQNYLLFITASIILCAVPGPDMILLLTRSVAQGHHAGFIAALGCNTGNYVHLFAAVVGLSAIIAASTYAFLAIKLVGAVYLIYVGVTTLLAKDNPLAINADGQHHISHRACFWQGFWSDVLNPKVAMFYLAFFPQFITPGDNTLMQLLVLGFTLNTIGLVVALIVVAGASAFTSRLRRDPRIAAMMTKALGVVFVALGVRLATEKVL